jgi:hypothetical protein
VPRDRQDAEWIDPIVLQQTSSFTSVIVPPIPGND